ncbi:MAG: hydrogenase maturation protease [Desulfobacterota bacterium]|nr:hydrogenase maturation protease [Thermodesulfobacteriota bacterium]
MKSAPNFHESILKVEYRNESETQYRDILVLGCGNILFGDDGFGPCVIEYLQKHERVPENVSLLNVGTSVRGILFDILLSSHRPKKIIVVDAVDLGREPGTVFPIDIDEMPLNKIDDFTLHEMPTSNLLKELKEFCDIEVLIIAGQIAHLPEEVKPGLSDPLQESLPLAAQEVLKACRG